MWAKSSDAKPGVAALVQELSRKVTSVPPAKVVKDGHQSAPINYQGSRLHPGKLVQSLSKMLPTNCIISGDAGTNTVRFSGRMGHKALRVGRYRLELIAQEGGVRSATRRLGFRIVPAKRKPPLWLKPGDIVEVEIDKLGILRNGVADEA